MCLDDENRLLISHSSFSLGRAHRSYSDGSSHNELSEQNDKGRMRKVTGR
jgi:hypothetical protein